MKKYVTPALRVIEIKADSSLLAGSNIKADNEHGAATGTDNLSVFDVYHDDWDEADEEY